jgi:hypothetical protein
VLCPNWIAAPPHHAYIDPKRSLTLIFQRYPHIVRIIPRRAPI